MWGLADTFWVAVGQREFVVLYDGEYPLIGYDQSIRREDIEADPYDNVELFGVWGSSETDIYVVGKGRQNSVFNGIVFHYDGTTWTNEPMSPTVGLFGIWGDAPYNVYVVGGGQDDWRDYPEDLTDPAIFHFDGTSWNSVTVPAGVSGLYDVWGTPGGDTVIAVGAYGSIVKCSSPLGFKFQARDLSRQELVRAGFDVLIHEDSRAICGPCGLSV